jgi:hypothetical protein
VVARDRDHWDLGVAQTVHLPREVGSRAEVRPVSVEEITGDQERVGLLVDRQIDEVCERCARGEAQLLDGRSVVASESPHGAIEVDVGCVNEFH